MAPVEKETKGKLRSRLVEPGEVGEVGEERYICRRVTRSYVILIDYPSRLIRQWKLTVFTLTLSLLGE
jgi:hypothetical protein